MTIGTLAVPGVLIGILLTGLIVTMAIQGTGLNDAFTWRHGLLFGALVAATHPIAVVGLFRHLNAPPRLTVLVEGESLINDGTSIVAFTLILAFLSGRATSGLIFSSASRPSSVAERSSEARSAFSHRE